MLSTLLPESTLCGMLVGLSCRRCGGRGPTWRVSRPALTLGPDVARVEVTVRCACGGRIVRRMELPVLQFGLLLAHNAAVELCAAGLRPAQPDQRVTARPSETLIRISKEYRQIVNRVVERALVDAAEPDLDAAAPSGPRTGAAPDGCCEECAARDVWDMSPVEWAQFLRRLGFTAPPGAERQQPGPADADPPPAAERPDAPRDAGGPAGPEGEP